MKVDSKKLPMYAFIFVKYPSLSIYDELGHTTRLQYIRCKNWARKKGYTLQRKSLGYYSFGPIMWNIKKYPERKFVLVVYGKQLQGCTKEKSDQIIRSFRGMGVKVDCLGYDFEKPALKKYEKKEYVAGI